VPLVPSGPPLQPPAAAHEAALLELQVKVEVPPGAITEGYTESVADGTTFTVAVAGALVPPAPEHVNEKVEFAVSAPVLREPLAASAPLQPPAAVHAVAWADDQVSVDVPPTATMIGLALSVAVGSALTVMVTAAG
jgi:hypothetical protein